MTNRNKNNYNKSNRIELKILYNARGQYLYSKGKPRGITLNIIH